MGTGTEREQEQERVWRRTKERRTGPGTGVDAGRGRGRGRGWRPVDEHRMGTGTEARTVAEMGTGTRITGNGNEDRIGEGGREANKRKKPENIYRRYARNGGDLEGKRKECRKERVGSVAANPDNLESNKEARGGAHGTQGSSKNCTSRESVSLLSRLIRGFRNKYN